MTSAIAKLPTKLNFRNREVSSELFSGVKKDSTEKVRHGVHLPRRHNNPYHECVSNDGYQADAAVQQRQQDKYVGGDVEDQL